MSNLYKLECALQSHEQDVRAVASLSNDFILSAARDKTVRSWTRTGPNEFSPHNTYLGHQHYVNSLVAIPSTNEHHQGLFASAGSDKLILVYEPYNPSSPLYTLVGHTENVCALSIAPNGDLISGSWDKKVIVWENYQQKYILEGHSAAVWAVLGIDDDAVLTASADKTIRLWKNGKQVKVFSGHSDAVRGLTLVPNVGFASCSNDGTIRIWSLEGDCLQELYGHTSFVYSIATLSTGELVSSGEDRTVRIWKDGECIQTIQQPCISVWTVTVLPNDDIVVGGSDATVRVFTRSAERYASAEDIKQLEDLLASQAIPSNQIGDVDKNKLPGQEALNKPGNKEGQVIMVNINGSVEAHQWDSMNKVWQKIGEVVGGVGSGQKQLHNGKEYDFVFDIDIGAGPDGMLKLPYNLNQNPYDAAQKFCVDNDLTPAYVEQIVEFISKNTQGVSISQNTGQYQDPFTGGSRYTPGQSATGTGTQYQDPFTGGNRYTPGQTATTTQNNTYFDPFTGASGYHGGTTQNNVPTIQPTTTAKSKILPVCSYLSMKQANVDAVENKLKSLNEGLNGSEKLGEDELNSLTRLSQFLKNPASSSVGEEGLLTIIKICTTWAPQNRFPALDILRLIALYATEDLLSAIPNGNAVAFFNEVGNIDKVLTATTALDKITETNAMLAYRGLANLFNHQVGRQAILAQQQELLSVLQTDIVVKYKAKTTRLAISTLTLNFAVFLTVDQRNEDSEISLTGTLAELIKQEQDEENLYRFLMALGTLFTHNTACIEMATILDIKVELQRLKKETAGRDRLQSVVDELKTLSS